MLSWAENRLKQLEAEGLSGFIFKNNSPSCGLNSVFDKKGTGLFAREFVSRFKLIPVADEATLRDSGVMKNFIERISSFRKTSLYVHIPFCRQKCFYCDFYSAAYKEDLAKSYIKVILKQIGELNQSFSSIYIGGGTPSILSPDLLDKLLSGLKKFIKPGMEFTIEVNPESVDEEKLRLFLAKGINRISIGVQSFDDKKLKSLGRIHSAKQAVEAIELSRNAGFKNISIDMIFGVEGEDLEAWQSELEKAAGCGCQHISCYSLSYEKDTPLFRMREKKTVTPLDDDIAAQMYAYTIACLPKIGFKQYEVSNFAKPGFECSHNLNYWDNNPYIGIGPSAVSYINGARSENVRGVEEYIDRYEKGVSLIAYSENLSDIQRARETAGVKIRVKQGIDYNWFKDKTGFDFEGIVEKLAIDELFRDNLIEYVIDKATRERIGIKLTEKGFLFSDTVSAAFL
jgi:oxygen-independent coproporphyrinogen-3 oxidase